MTKEETAERIKVMQAYVDGNDIEFYNKIKNEWELLTVPPLWDSKTNYRIAPSKKYRPFKNADEAFKEAKKHGFWVKENECGYYHAITFIGSCICYIDDNEYDYIDLLLKFVWADDGSECGILEE